MGFDMATLHVRYEGQSIDLTMEDIDLGDLSTDTDIRESVAKHLNQPVNKFNNMAIDRSSETGDITMRPQAVFGS